MATVPELVNTYRFARRGSSHQALRHNSVGTPGASEPSCFGKAPELDGAFLGAGYFIYGMGNVLLGDIGLIGTIEEDYRLVFQGIVHPCLQHLWIRHNTCGVIGKAEINDVYLAVRQLGQEVICFGAWHVVEAMVTALRIGFTSSTCHDVGVNVNGVCRISHSDNIIHRKDFLNIATIAFGAVTDKDFVGIETNGPGLVVICQDKIYEKLISLLGAVSPKGLGFAHLANGLMQRIDDRRWQGLGDVTDA